MGLGECLVGAEERALVLSALDHQQLFRYYGTDPNSPPPMAATLEREFAARNGTRFVLGVNSGTTALEAALGALGVGRGDEVIIPVWSWISCFTAVVRVGARPVLAEIDDSLSLDPREITRLRTARTKAVLVVHFQGVAADMTAILAAAGPVPVLEDCAESAGASYRGRPVGNFGAIATFSFQARKVVTAGEGGLVATNDPRLYERAVRMSDLGQYRPFHERQKPATEIAFSGSNYRMNELTAAVALAQVRRLDAMLAHLRGLRDRLMRGIGEVPGLGFRRLPDPTGDLGFETYLKLPSAVAAVSLRAALTKAGVSSAQHTGTYCHYARAYCQNRRTHDERGSPFAEFATWPAPGYREADFPQTRELIERMVAIPLGMLHTGDDADYVAAAIRHGLGC